MTGSFEFVFDENSVEEIMHMITVEPTFSGCLGLVWTVGLTVDIKLRFQISPA